MHGILEELSLYQPEFLRHPDVICDIVPLADKPSCFHGMGHVFMFAHKRNAKASIAGCRSIIRATDMYRCFEGVRMEQFWGNSEHTGTTSLGWDLAKPLSPCIEAEQDAKPTCFLYSPFGYLRFHPKDYEGAVHMCTKSALKDIDAEFCLKGLGMTMMSKFKGQNLEGSEKYVAESSPKEKHAFYQGVIGYARLSGIKEVELQKTCSILENDTTICEAVLEEKID